MAHDDYPVGYREGIYVNPGAYYDRLPENDPSVLAIGDVIAPREYNDFARNRESLGFKVGHVLMWRRHGGYDIFPILYKPDLAEQAQDEEL